MSQYREHAWVIPWHPRKEQRVPRNAATGPAPYFFLYLKQSTTWSSTMPVACMCAWQTVGPTNLKPRFFKSLDRASDSGEVAFMVCLVMPLGWHNVRLPV